jgi:hypothetical protein
MPFNLTTWKQSIATRLKTFNQEMPVLGIQSLFGFLTTITLLPVVQAAAQIGDPILPLLGLAGSVGGNLLASELEKWRDRAEQADTPRALAESLLPQLATRAELRAETLWRTLQVSQDSHHALGATEVEAL